MREQMRTDNFEGRFQKVFNRYLEGLPLFLDFINRNGEILVFQCKDKALPYPKWKKIITHMLDFTETVEVNIGAIGEKLFEFYPKMLEVSVDYREPTALELKLHEGKKSLDELLKSKVEVVTTRKHVITRVNIRMDRVHVLSVETKDGTSEYWKTTSVYRTKKPVSTIMKLLLQARNDEERFNLFSDNTVYLNELVPTVKTIDWADESTSGDA